jgi:hypothetical protein
MTIQATPRQSYDQIYRSIKQRYTFRCSHISLGRIDIFVLT